MAKIGANDIERAVYSYFAKSLMMAVPNISWGMGVHECDLFLVKKSGYAVEVEIKISRADLKKDAAKPHGHRSNKIRELYFAMPRAMEKDIELVPERAGILLIDDVMSGDHVSYRIAREIRKPEINKMAPKLSDKDLINVGRLGCMRIWKGGTNIQDYSKGIVVRMQEMKKEYQELNKYYQQELEKNTEMMMQAWEYRGRIKRLEQQLKSLGHGVQESGI